MLKVMWGYSSVGRAPALHAGGQGFESLILHCLRKVSGSGGSRMYLENRTTCKRKQCITKKRDRDNRYQQDESLMMSGNLRFQPRSQESESKEFQDLKEIQRSDWPKGQAKKGTRWMPWYWEPKKDVTSCEKLRGGAHILWYADIWLGEPGASNIASSIYE